MYLVVVIFSVHDNQSSPFVCLCDHCIVYFDLVLDVRYMCLLCVVLSLLSECCNCLSF